MTGGKSLHLHLCKAFVEISKQICMYWWLVQFLFNLNLTQIMWCDPMAVYLQFNAFKNATSLIFYIFSLTSGCRDGRGSEEDLQRFSVESTHLVPIFSGLLKLSLLASVHFSPLFVSYVSSLPLITTNSAD